jgi:ADP-ribose pyrophosphatase YjhB (NUDIX family)
VAVGVVVWKDDKVLLIRRAKPPRSGQWSIPGGAQELGETVRDTALREVKEETGLDIAVTDFIEVVDFIERDDAGDVLYHYTLVDWSAEWRDGEAIPGDDVSEILWIDPDELERFGIWSETVRIIRHSAKRRRS